MDLTPEQTRIYRDYITIGKRFKEKKFDPRRKRALSLYRGDQAKPLGDDQDNVIINEIKTHINNKVAAIAGQPPTWAFTPNNPDATKAAMILPYILPQIWDDVKAHDVTKLCFKESRMYVIGITRTGYLFETKDVSMMGERPEGADQAFTGQIIHDNPFVERVDPDKFIFDPETDHPNLEKCKWCGMQLQFEKEELQNDKRFDQSVVAQLSPDSEIKRDYTGTLTDIKDNEHIKRYTIWEFYDFRKNLILYLSESADKPLYVMENPYGFNPFDLVWCDIDPEGPYEAKSDVEDLASQQFEKDLLHSKFATRIRRSGNKYQGPENALTEAGRTALESDEENALVELAQDAVNAKIELLTKSTDNLDIISYDNMLDRSMAKTSGITEYQQGVMPTEQRTATEANITANLAGTRSNADLDEYQDFCERIAKKLIKLLSTIDENTGLPKFMPAERYVRLAGEELTQEFLQLLQDNVQQQGKYAWLRYTGADLSPNVDVKAEYGSTQKANKEVEKKQELDLYNILAANPIINHTELTRSLLIKFNKDPEKLLQQQQSQAAPEKPISVTIKENIVGGVREYDVTAPDVATVANVIAQLGQVISQSAPPMPPGTAPPPGQIPGQEPPSNVPTQPTPQMVQDMAALMGQSQQV